MRKTFIFILAIFLFFTSNAQNRIIDSLKYELKSISGEEKVELYCEISKSYWHYSADSSLVYAQKAMNLAAKLNFDKGIADAYNRMGNAYSDKYEYEKALEYYQKSLSIRLRLGDSDDISGIWYNIANLYQAQYISDSAIVNFNKALEESQKRNDTEDIIKNNIGLAYTYYDINNYAESLRRFNLALKIIEEAQNYPVQLAEVHNSLGMIYSELSNFEKSLSHYLIALELFQKLSDDEAIAVIYNNLAIEYQSLGEIGKALEYFNKSLAIEIELRNKEGQASVLSNIGTALKDKGEIDRAIEYYYNALELAREMENHKDISLCLHNLGSAYLDKARYDEAERFFMESLSHSQLINDNAGIIHVYNNLANLYIAKGELIKAENYLLKAIHLNEEVGILELQTFSFMLYTELLEKQQNYKEALKYSKLFKEFDDSMYNDESLQQISHLQVIHETKEKQQQIQLLENESLLKEEQLAKQLLRKRLYLVGFFIISLFLLATFYQLRIISKKRKELQVKNKEINEQNEEILSQRDEIEAQRDLVTKQKDRIEIINEEITDSINYAKSIQYAILPHDDVLSNLLKNYFVLFKPKDIVSGDFYWIGSVEEKVIIAVADCTGHGVPGAFMSMLGMSALNDIVNKEYITHTGVILRRLRKGIIEALHQKEEYGEQRDGMDIAICSIDFKNKKLQYSGANNPLYLVRNKELQSIESDKVIENNNAVLYEIKADKMPISLHDRMDKYASHELDILDGDSIYLFSDGFADQFGGERGKKFMYKPFKELLLKTNSESANKQKRLVDETFEKWKAGNPQVDDVVLLGIKF